MAQYTLGQNGAEELERARLALLEEVHDPYTVRQFTGECFERELDKSIFEARREATPGVPRVCQNAQQRA